MKRYKDIDLRTGKEYTEIIEMLQNDVNIWNAHYTMYMKDGREYPYVVEVMNKGIRRFYQVQTRDEFEDLVDEFGVSNKVIDE